MTYEEFRKAHPATRCFQRYDHTVRADRAASHRLTARQRSAVGEYYYVHPLVPSNGFPSAKLATLAAYERWKAANLTHQGGEVAVPVKRKRTTTKQRLEAACLTLAEALAASVLGPEFDPHNRLLEALGDKFEGMPDFPEEVEDVGAVLRRATAIILDEVLGAAQGQVAWP